MGFRPAYYRYLGLAVLALTTAVRAEDGELFPNVKSYDEEVQAPVSKPEQALEKPKPVRVRREPPPLVVPDVPKEPAKEVVKEPTPTPAKEVVKEPVRVEQKAELRWASYREHLLSPLMSEESQKRFDSEFASRVQTNLKVKDGGAEAEKLWKDAEAGGVPADLKRALWLDALGLSIHSGSDLDDRADMAKKVLPLLVEDTLPVAQARADSVTELAYGALSKASDSLLAIVTESQCKLARLQVQGGYPNEAAASMKVAREAFGLMKVKSESAKDAVAEAGAWVDRANGARALSAQWAQTIATRPNDVTTNTQLAVLNLSLYGDVEKAAGYAAKSDVVELKAMAAAMTKSSAEAADRAKTLKNILTLAGALLDVADGNSALPFDRSSIGHLVDAKVGQLIAGGELTPDLVAQAKGLQTRAQGEIAKSSIRSSAYSALAELAKSGGDSKTAAGGGAAEASTLQLFVKDNGTVVKYVKPTAKLDAQAMTLIRAQSKSVSERIGIKLTEIETQHCVIYTDWNPSEHGFLKKNVEGAYIAAAKLFNFPLTESVFPGKLPVYNFEKQETFVAFAKAVSGKDNSKNMASFDVTDSGIGYIQIYKQQPSARLLPIDCVNEWGRGISWEMTEAFIARYRTNKDLPGWLAAGLCARVSYNQFDQELQREAIQKFLMNRRHSVASMMNNGPRDSEDQAVAGAMVEMLIQKDAKNFVNLINKIKDGEDPKDAFKECFKVGYDEAEKAWRTWINGG